MIRDIGLALVMIAALAGCQARSESEAHMNAVTQRAESSATRAETAAGRVDQAAGRAEAAAQRAEAVLLKLEGSHQGGRSAYR